MDSGEPKETRSRWVQIAACEGAIFMGKDTPEHAACPTTLCHEMCKND